MNIFFLLDWCISRLEFSYINKNYIEPIDCTFIYSSNDFFQSLNYIQPEILLVVSLICSFLYVVSIYYSPNNDSYSKLTIINFFINFLIFILFLVLLFYSYNFEFFLYNFTILLFEERLILNTSLTLLKMFLTFFTIIALYLVKISNKDIKYISRILPEYSLYSPEILFIAVLNLFFLLLLISVTDFFLFILVIQGLTVTTYFLFLGSNSKISSANTLRYYFFSSWVLILLIFSSLLFYVNTASMNFFSIYTDIADSFLELDLEDFSRFEFYHYQTIIAMFLFFFALFFKLGLSPLHPWTVDVCRTMPKPFLFITMVVNKFGLFIVLIRISLNLFGDLSIFWQPLFFLVGFLSVFYGVIHLHAIKKIKVFFAYVMLQSTGFLLIILSLCSPGVQETLTFNAVSFIYQYFFISFFSWSVFFLIWVLCGNFINLFWQHAKTLSYISDLELLGVILKHYGYLARSGFTLSILVLIGFPPFLTFFIKFYALSYVLSFYGSIFVILLLLLFILLIYKNFDIFRSVWLFYSTEDVAVAEEIIVSDERFLDEAATTNVTEEGFSQETIDSLEKQAELLTMPQEIILWAFIAEILLVHLRLDGFMLKFNVFVELFFLTLM